MIRFLEKTKWINGSVAEQGRDKTKFSRKRKYLNKEKKNDIDHLPDKSSSPRRTDKRE